MSTVIQPDGWAVPRGYSNGIAAQGEILFVGGQIGWDPRSTTPKFPEGGFAAQWDQAVANVIEVVRAAGGQPEHIARLTIYVVDKKEYLASLKELGAIWRKHFGRHYPAMALVQVVALVEDLARVEIEATAVLP
ncbi:MAG: RidA family protein [Archangium sp.]|nr:RidA family protein [Archangium sp.]